jgi:hypothetical protein
VIEFVVKDRDDPSYKKNNKNPPTRVVTRRGQHFEIGGKQIELFPVSVMAESIDRTPKCLIRWERAKLFPKPLFVIPGRRPQRWYSGYQIMNCHRIARMRYKFCKGRHFDPKAFCADLRSVFDFQKLVVKSDGTIVQKR